MITTETIDRLLRFDGDGLPVVSLYAGVPAGDRSTFMTRITSLLDELNRLAADETRGRDGRLSIRGDIERIKNSAREQRTDPGGVAYFSCTAAGLFEQFQLPRRVRERVVADTTPWLRPMLALLDEYHRSCIAVVDRKSAHIWELFQDELREVADVLDPALRKPDYGGWHGREEFRVRNHSDELWKRHYRRVVVTLDELFRTEGFELLIVAGHEDEIPPFLHFLPPHLRGRVAGTFAVDPETVTRGELKERGQRIVDDHERAAEGRLVDDVFERAAAGGLATVGLERCLWAASAGAVQTLLVHGDAGAPGVVCDESGWLALAGASCPLCGNPTRPTPDIVDDLAATVSDDGGSVAHVYADTKLSQPLVAASLRFPLPPLPSG